LESWDACAVQKKEGGMKKLCLAAVLAGLPGMGLACAVMSPFALTDLAGADIVVAEARALLD
jgi:hypothetical protein